MNQEFTQPDNRPKSQGESSGPMTREELYELAWSIPMLRIAERFAVSSSYMARVCTELRVPRPGAGYWTLAQFGRVPERPPLPPARPGDMVVWEPGLSIGHGQKVSRKRSAPATEISKARNARRGQRHPPQKETGPSVHPLVLGVKPLFLNSREKRNGLLYPFKKQLVDIISSAQILDAALGTANFLFLALTKRGHRLMLASPHHQARRAEVSVWEAPEKNQHHEAVWAPSRPTLVFIDDVCMGLTFYEILEKVEVTYVNGKYIPTRDLTDAQRSRYTGPRYWKSTEYRPSGRLALQAYCPDSYRVKWTEQWKESKPGELRRLIPSVVASLESSVPELTRQLEVAREEARVEHEKWEEQKRRWQEEAEQKRRQAAQQSAQQELRAAINAWDESQKIEAYFRDVLLAVTRLPTEEQGQLRERVALARKLVDAPDALQLLKQWRTPKERL